MRELADGHAEGDEWRCEPRRLVSDLLYFTYLTYASGQGPV